MKSVDPGILPHSVCFSFTPSDLERELFFYPTWCGHYYCTSNYYMNRESYPPLLLVYIRKGVFHFRYRERRFEAHAGDIVLIDCAEPHYYRAADGLEFLYLHFEGSNAKELCRHIMDMQGSLIQRENNAVIGKMLYDFINLHVHNQVENMFETSLRIYSMLAQLMTSHEAEYFEENPIDKTIQYIRSNVGKQITLDELASIANLSVYYYSHCFKEQTGFSPMEYVINTRLSQAKILLVRTSKSVSEISFEVGYASSGSLINLFMKKVGMSPKMYRRSHIAPSESPLEQ